MPGKRSSSARIPSYRHDAATTSAIDELIAMSEHDLQAMVIEPLLRELDFKNVKVNAGSDELGKDLVATTVDEFGQPLLWAIQIKRFKPTAQVGTDSSFGRLLDQLRQALQEPVIDPSTNVERACDRCIFITPYPLSLRVRRAFQQRSKEAIFKVLKVIDGALLVDLIKQRLPETLDLFSADTRYRLRAAAEANRMIEMPVALGTTELRVEDLYVDASLAQKDMSIELLATRHFRSPGARVIDATPTQLNELISLYLRWTGKAMPVVNCSVDMVGGASTRVQEAISKVTSALRALVRTVLEADPRYRLTPAPEQVDELGFEQLRMIIRSRSPIPESLRALLPAAVDRHQREAVKAALETMLRTKNITKPVHSYLTDLAEKQFRQEQSHRLSEAIEQEVQKARSGQPSVIRPENIPAAVMINLDALYREVRAKTRSYVNQALPTLQKPSATAKECTSVVVRGARLRQEISDLGKVKTLKRFWPSLLSGDEQDHPHRPFAIPASMLGKVQQPILVTGAPGSGKTTLLRRLTQLIAKQDGDQLPILVPLVSVGDRSVLAECSNQLRLLGYKSASADPEIQLRSGRFRLLFDGLDEAGSDAGRLMKEIDRLVRACPKTNVILSSRDTFGSTKWDRAFTVRLNPFSDKQLAEFVAKWFSSAPTSRTQLLSWIHKNDDINAISRTPLIAALLCSLFEAHADMPSTELELYERRFELLLGRWEQAKGIQPLSLGLRKRYRHFLMSIAFRMHKDEKRSLSVKDAIAHAEDYYSQKYHTNAQGLVEDCLRRELFETSALPNVSFGHLSYQEYLAAEWLAEQNPTKFVWSRLLSPWWAKVLQFYASRKLDITPLVREGLHYAGESRSLERMLDLIKCAPLTSKAAVEAFRRQSRGPGRSKYDWQGRSPEVVE